MSLLDNTFNQYSLSPSAAKRLSNKTISVPMMEAITPRWLLTFLPWVSTEAGIYRVNKVTREAKPEVFTNNLEEHNIPHSFPDYDPRPREYTLSIVQTVLKLNGQVTDLFNSPINQKQEQMRLTIEAMREQQEWEIINNSEFGLVASVDPSMKISSRNGSASPDDMDELLTKVWKKPAFFVAHPRSIAAFGRECTRRGVPPVAINLYGSPFLTWRGVPILPCDKLEIDKNTGTTNILLMRVGEREQGVIGLHQQGLPGECHIPSLSVHFGGIDSMGIASYIMTLYFGAAVLTDDSLGMLENVDVGRYHDYD
ncbi:hypothetical protein GC105_08705 [Alkalibaculum sp. M08DMB]|uniref:Type 2A encapsulin shell protein SrpI-like domain-containing protein n=1 Tax=Alkalibaculum sporogenes TaxID=2655001 RepID=A0A6A7K8S4_9FIRM|nr:family 2A encapsulin nanocompartment shell protein [Alkalibaculum sporogenes]MPW25868.1 hypothetical protein [Alkalibaculum sporogenes]